MYVVVPSVFSYFRISFSRFPRSTLAVPISRKNKKGHVQDSRAYLLSIEQTVESLKIEVEAVGSCSLFVPYTTYVHLWSNCKDKVYSRSNQCQIKCTLGRKKQWKNWIPGLTRRIRRKKSMTLSGCRQYGARIARSTVWQMTDRSKVKSQNSSSEEAVQVEGRRDSVPVAGTVHLS
jgi:hypothetical protein